MESIEEFMLTKQPFCTADDNIKKVSLTMINSNTSEIVIVDNEKHFYPVGIVYERDINNCCIAHGKNPDKTHSYECMKKIKVTIRNNMSPEQCLDILEKNHLQSAPVIDEQEKFCGIVTKDELVRLFND